MKSWVCENCSQAQFPQRTELEKQCSEVGVEEQDQRVRVLPGRMGERMTMELIGSCLLAAEAGMGQKKQSLAEEQKVKKERGPDGDV